MAASELAAAFWSYAHLDDEREAGRVARLAELLKAEFALLTGTELQLFIDLDGIKWGDRFRSKIDEALQQTTFFIPILTPTYFVRDECRNEMFQFVNAARALGLQDQLLSIRYVPMTDLREDSTDELKAIAAGMQYEDWATLRFAGEKSARHRTAVNRLAQRILDLSLRLESGDSPGPNAPARSTPKGPRGPGGSAAVEAEETEEVPDDAPGTLDLLAELQPRLEAWTATVVSFSEPATTINQVLTEGAQQFNATSSQPNEFARRIRVARDIAERVEAPLQEIETMSKRYSAQLLEIDRPVRAFIDAVFVAMESGESEEAREALDSLLGLVRTASEAAGSLAGAADASRTVANMSRDLRPVFRRYESAVRNIVDGQSVIDGWATEIERRDPGAPGGRSLDLK